MYSSPGNVSNSSNNPSRNLTTHYPILNHRHHRQAPIMIPVPTVLPYASSNATAVDEDEIPRRDERFIQWSNQETRDFIEIRAQLEWEFSASKRNKNLWEMVSSRMREKGFRRTADQCKCKWKNLVNRYKGIEASDLENDRLCPFFDEMHAVFTARANRLQEQANLDSEEAKRKRQNANLYQSQQDFSFEQNYEEEEEEEESAAGKGKFVPERKTNTVREKRQKTERIPKESPKNTENNAMSLLKETLGNFLQQQQMIDMKWRELSEKREQEKELAEQEWRMTMEKLERERMAMEQARREREEQWRLREDSRAEKRDALLNALLHKLVRDDDRC